MVLVVSEHLVEKLPLGLGWVGGDPEPWDKVQTGRNMWFKLGSNYCVPRVPECGGLVVVPFVPRIRVGDVFSPVILGMS